MKSYICLAVSLIFLRSCAFFKSSPSKMPVYEAHTFVLRGDTLPYRLLKPVEMEEKCVYPLVIFLHGAGERGNDNEKQLTHGTYLFQKQENAKKFPCFVLAPQCPEDSFWVETPWNSLEYKITPEPSQPLKNVYALVLELMDSLPIDSERIYITGLSMGGFGTWDMLARWPELFAAGVPICGGGDAETVPRFAHIPLWIFHSADDPVVPVEFSRRMVDALEKADASFHYTEYKDAGHASWKRAYEEPELLPWLFSQRKSIPSAYNNKKVFDM
ncbi:MAG: prolyl oligopeptidase family serine peptidase [Candidatus Marinimicrobia bacterium]|nr:prolyl oligopeptidase family serine peptidase [Candidatus Neomarinimicrobiota bacterium]MDD5582812.1 prolyl oligopeptidase family serine peptidase [Candidatus Neomarinimicrobiota bacterium]